MPLLNASLRSLKSFEPLTALSGRELCDLSFHTPSRTTLQWKYPELYRKMTPCFSIRLLIIPSLHLTRAQWRVLDRGIRWHLFFFTLAIYIRCGSNQRYLRKFEFEFHDLSYVVFKFKIYDNIKACKSQILTQMTISLSILTLDFIYSILIDLIFKFIFWNWLKPRHV